MRDYHFQYLKIYRYVLYSGVLLSLVFIFVPLSPKFPQNADLDVSWALAMSEAVSRGLIFGREIIFTFGPYANLYTHFYNPQIDKLLLISGFILSFCYASLLILLMYRRSLFLLSIYCIGLLTLLKMHQFLTYPLLLSLVIYQYVQSNHATKWQLAILLLSFIPLSLLILIKGSFLLGSVMTLVLCCSFLLQKGRYKTAISAPVIFIISLMTFWVLAKQPIAALSDYFLTLHEIIDGYTNAMSHGGRATHVLAYIASSLLILFACFAKSFGSLSNRLFLMTIFGLHFFLAFKGGFVRHDVHEVVAGINLMTAGILFASISHQKSAYKIMLTSLICGLYIISSHPMVYMQMDGFNKAVAGISIRNNNPDLLKNRYDETLSQINNRFDIPPLKGSVDIYDNRVAVLLSSNNEWSPRPIIQSYQAYTPQLAKWNLQHLEGENSPQNILFRIKTIDNRLPSLDDGLSWPYILENYILIDYKNEFLYLYKKITAKKSDSIINPAFFNKNVNLSESIVLPDSRQPLFATIEITPTLLGKIFTILYKLPKITITLIMADEKEKKYRLISGLAQSGFILSPLIENTNDFINLAEHGEVFNKTVKSFKITSPYQQLFWQPQYKIQLHTLNLDLSTVKNRTMDNIQSNKIILPGGAGLVGLNLIIELKAKGFNNLIVIDKHKKNINILKKLHPDICVEYADLAETGSWIKHFNHADIVIMLQAQIGHTEYQPFVRNNIKSTENVIAAIKKFNVPYIIHISSSVVESMADDYYTQTKRLQEKMVVESDINYIVLRPTLMFGWFDRKHLGWLSRFMKKIPIFPIPGKGNFLRQPLYVGDFCNIIVSCIQKPIFRKSFNVTGLEYINYIDMMHEIRRTIKAKCLILKIPYRVFYVLLKCWSLFDKNPPFTVDQLKALTASDIFEVIDWPSIFEVKATSFSQAIAETYNHPSYSKVVLDF